MRSISTARALLGILAPLTGTRSTGSVTVTATGADVVIPLNAKALPVLTSGGGNPLVRYEHPVRVSAETTVTSGGTSVPLTSLLGGSAVNFPIGTTLKWDPPIAGIDEPALTVAMVDGAAGTNPCGWLRQLLFYEGIGGKEAALKLFQGGVKELPVGVLSWERSDSYEARGGPTHRRRNVWQLTVVSNRFDAPDRRSVEGLNILDDAEELLGRRSKSDGVKFTEPIELLGRNRILSNASAFIYALQFATRDIVRRTDRTDYPDWATTNYDGAVDESTPRTIIDDVQWEQP